MFKKRFQVSTKWDRDGRYSEGSPSLKTHTVNIEGKDSLIVSADKSFKGDGTKYNPEDMLLTSLASCHMMSYFYVCEQSDIQIVSYEDTVDGVLIINSDSSGQFSTVRINPRVVISEKGKLQLAKNLHTRAHELCFIANSCNFEIVVSPVILALE